jgi:hypothetical protein
MFTGLPCGQTRPPVLILRLPGKEVKVTIVHVVRGRFRVSLRKNMVPEVTARSAGVSPAV